MTAEELWSEFIRETGIPDQEYSAWDFGGEPDALAQLVLDGIKTATASAFPLYAIEDEELPKVGEYSVILDSRDRAVCVIRTTRVYTVPFSLVTKEHAYKEGEGDRSLNYWRQVHRVFFTECMQEVGAEFTEDMPVVCEEFELVYKQAR